MFLHLSVSHSVHGGGATHPHLLGRHPQGRHPPGRHTPRADTTPRADALRWPLQWTVCILLECILVLKVFTGVTRMHSSRMRTGRSLTVCCSLLPGGGGGSPCGGPAWSGGGSPCQRGVCLVWGGSPCWGGSAWSGGGLPAPGGGGFSLPGGPARRTPPVDRITETCKNITLAITSLRPVITVTVSAKVADKDVSKVTDTLTGKIVVHPLCPSERCCSQKQ